MPTSKGAVSRTFGTSIAPVSWSASLSPSVQTTVRYTQENIENLRHPVDDAYRANLTELQERLTKAAHKGAVAQARKTRQLLTYRKED